MAYKIQPFLAAGMANGPTPANTSPTVITKGTYKVVLFELLDEPTVLSVQARVPIHLGKIKLKTTAVFSLILM